jgi:hypothetical protein
MGTASKNAPPRAERCSVPTGVTSTRRIVSERHHTSRWDRDLEHTPRRVSPHLAVGSARIRDGVALRSDRGARDRYVVGARLCYAHGHLGVPARDDHGDRTTTPDEEIILVEDVVVDDERTRRDDEFVRRLAAEVLHVSADAAAANEARHPFIPARAALDLHDILRRDAGGVSPHLREDASIGVRCGRRGDNLGAARSRRAPDTEVLPPNSLAVHDDGKAPLVDRRDLRRQRGCESRNSDDRRVERSHEYNIPRKGEDVLVGITAESSLVITCAMTVVCA